MATRQRTATLLRGGAARTQRWGAMSSRWTALVMVAVAAAIVVLRRPDALFDPQFSIEDGPAWFQPAWNHQGFAALTHPWVGYLQTFPRLVALAAPILGLRWSPLLFNLVAIAVQVAPAVLLVSSRAENVVPSLRVRILLASVYLVLPCIEINANLTNAQWHLAVLAFLVLVVRPPTSAVAKGLDAIVVVLSCLTGPFGLVLAPIALILWLQRRDSHAALLLAASGIATAVQLIVIVGNAGTRSRPALGTSIRDAAVLMINKVALFGLMGEDQRGPLIAGSTSSLIWALPVGVVAAGTLLVCLLRGPMVLRLFIAMGVVIMLGGILDPPLESGRNAWQTAAHNTRYFFLIALGLACGAVWLASRAPTRSLRTLGVLAVCGLLAVGVSQELQYPALPTSRTGYYAQVLEDAARGTVISVPEWSGPRYTMHLIAW